jgi:hypothetical protein
VTEPVDDTTDAPPGPDATELPLEPGADVPTPAPSLPLAVESSTMPSTVGAGTSMPSPPPNSSNSGLTPFPTAEPTSDANVVKTVTLLLGLVGVLFALM